jgi:Asp/Glu/hydantoin racemase
MHKTLAVIHTVLVFLQSEMIIRDTLAYVMPEVRIINIVDDSLLMDVMRAGITPWIIRRVSNYIVSAELGGADAVLSTCSSIGPAIDVARRMVRIPVVKIDEAMAEQAVQQATEIGVLATVRSTLRPTIDLLKEKAGAAGREIHIHDSLCGDAFEALAGGSRERHDRFLLQSAKDLSDKADVIVLAQASMARLGPRLSDETGLPVLSSVRSGIEKVKEILAQK